MTQLDESTRQDLGRPSLGSRLTGIQWIVCVVAALGFALDLYELLMMPLIIRPLLVAVGHRKPGSPEFNLWTGMQFFMPAVVGGIFGLLGGYVADLLGRRRVLTGSILLYSFSACAAGFCDDSRIVR